MPDYRRAVAPGATFFFTLVTHGRRPLLATTTAIGLLRAGFRRERTHHPFEIDAIVILPDHLHVIWTLPPGDMRFSMRWSAIKGEFTRLYLATGRIPADRSKSRMRRGEQAVWQRRFWEHVIRDDDDYGRHMDYVHYNPVKHGHVDCPHAWPASSFAKWVRAGVYPIDWMCLCRGRTSRPPDFSPIERFVAE
jgi:putative transposase